MNEETDPGVGAARSSGARCRRASMAWRWQRACAALLVVFVASCAQREVRDTPVTVPDEIATPWQVAVEQAKLFTLRIGFEPTDNFTRTTNDLQGFPFCGRAPRLVLPYSYEDPVIEWLDSLTAEQCRSAAPAMDTYHGASEALGEIATPVTPSMIASGVARIVYLVVHEDCHDQFSLPFGIEEPLCEVISYRSMLAISEQPGPWTEAERASIRSYSLENAALIRVHLRYYQQVAALYDRHGRGELREELLLRERAVVFAQAEIATGLAPGSVNNIVLANRMTYARHYPQIEQVFERLGSDLSRLVAFFREVDDALAIAEDQRPVSPRREGTVPGSTSGLRPAPRSAAAGTSRSRGASGAGGSARASRAAKAGANAGQARIAGKPRVGQEAAAQPSVTKEDPLAEIRAAEAATLQVVRRLLDRR